MSCSMDRTVIHCCVFSSFCRSRTQPHNRNGGESDGEQTKERAANTFYEISLSYCHEHGSRNRKKKKKRKEKKKREKKKGGEKIGRCRRWPKRRNPAKKMGLRVLRARLEDLRARTPEPTRSANHGKTKAFIPALSGLSCHPFLPNVLLQASVRIRP